MLKEVCNNVTKVQKKVSTTLFGRLLVLTNCDEAGALISCCTPFAEKHGHNIVNTRID